MFVNPTSPFTLVEDIGSGKWGLGCWGKTKFTFYAALLEIEMNDPAYQVVYGVGLLDDVHNYFPALLYDQGRFQTLTNVFSYVRSQLNNRFNLYAYGARLSQAQAQAQGQAQATTTAPPPMPPVVRTFRGGGGASDNEVMASASFLLNMLNLGLEGEAGFTPLRAGTFGGGGGGTGGTGGAGGAGGGVAARRQRGSGRRIHAEAALVRVFLRCRSSSSSSGGVRRRGRRHGSWRRGAQLQVAQQLLQLCINASSGRL